MVLSNITIYQIDVPSSHVKPGETGISIIASGVACNLSMNWYYSYSTWLGPVKISDKGRAEVQVWKKWSFGLFFGCSLYIYIYVYVCVCVCVENDALLSSKIVLLLETWSLYEAGLVSSLLVVWFIGILRGGGVANGMVYN